MTPKKPKAAANVRIRVRMTAWLTDGRGRMMTKNVDRYVELKGTAGFPGLVGFQAVVDR